MTTATRPVDPIHAERLRAMLDRLGMTHVQAAAYLGVPITTLSNWLYGHREPNAVAIRLLDVLGTIEAFAPDVHAMFLPPGERRI